MSRPAISMLGDRSLTRIRWSVPNDPRRGVVSRHAMHHWQRNSQYVIPSRSSVVSGLWSLVCFVMRQFNVATVLVVYRTL